MKDHVVDRAICIFDPGLILFLAAGSEKSVVRFMIDLRQFRIPEIVYAATHDLADLFPHVFFEGTVAIHVDPLRILDEDRYGKRIDDRLNQNGYVSATKVTA